MPSSSLLAPDPFPSSKGKKRATHSQEPMAEPTSPLFRSSVLPAPKPDKALRRQHPRILTSTFMYKVVFFVVLMALLPLFPAEAPVFMNQSILTRSWELLHLLLVGVAIAYGLFSSRNTDSEVDKEVQWKAGAESAPDSYASHILHCSTVFDEEEEEEEVDSPRGAAALADGKIQTWSSKYRRNQPVVMVANGRVTSGSHAAGKPLFLPVRSLRTRHQDTVASEDAERRSATGNREEARKDVIFSSSIPWKSRPGRMENNDEPSSSTDMAFPPPSHNTSPPPAFPGHAGPPKAPPLRSSSMNRIVSRTLSLEIRAKDAEDLMKRKSFNNYNFSPPPAPPPPPPPPFTGHVHPYAKLATKSFKDELKDLSRRGREFTQSSPLRPGAAEPRNSTDGSSVGRSVRTIRPKDVDEAMADATIETSFEQSSMRVSHMQSELHQRNQTEKRNEFLEDLVVSSDDDSHGDGKDDAVDSSAREDARETAPAETVAEGNEVDKKADEFIAKFREQIRLQRIESIKRVTGHRSRVRNSA